jgi:hypothetical protein
MATTQTPEDFLLDRKVEVMLTDLTSDCDDAVTTGKKMSKVPAMKHASSSTLSAYAGYIRSVESGLSSMESEWDKGIEGKLKDLKGFKKILQSLLDSLTTLEEINGCAEVLEDADLGAKIVAFGALMTNVTGPIAEMKRLQVEAAIVQKKLVAAEKLARDAKIKAVIGAAMTAATMAAAAGGPLSLAAGVGIFAGSLAVDAIVDAALDGREDSSAKAAWGWVDKGMGAADAVQKLPDALGPLGDLVNTGLDLAEVFGTEADKAALFKQIDKLIKDIKTAGPAYAKAFVALETAADEAVKALKSAISGINGVTPAKGSYHKLLTMM